MKNEAPLPWWHETNHRLRTDPYLDGALIDDNWLGILDDVERTFTARADATPPWPDPHAVPGDPIARREPRDEEYSRLSDPGKYAVLGVRVEAWLDVLERHGLATVRCHRDSDAPHGVGIDPDPERQTEGPGIRATETRVVTPRVDAPPLSILIWRHADGYVGLEVSIGDPPLVVERIPHCACDACDSGSAMLLEDLDRAVFSVVDGSIEVQQTERRYVQRTSFGAQSGSPSAADPPRTHHVRGISWREVHMSRSLVAPI